MTFLIHLLQSELVNIHTVFPDWGVAIFILTAAIRTLILPLQMIAAREKVKTWKSFLAVVIPLPVFIAMFRALTDFSSLMNQATLWITNLAAADPYFVLPVACAALIWVQSRQSRQTNRVLTNIAPLLSFGFLMSAPAGFVIYSLTNTAFQIAVNSFIHRSSPLV